MPNISDENGLKSGRFSLTSEQRALIYVTPLHRSHRRESFDCGKSDPNNYIRVNAFSNAIDWSTYVALLTAESLEIIAYYAVSPDPVQLERDYSQFDPEDLIPADNSEFDVVELKWLATDLRYAGNGIARGLLIRIFRKIADANALYPVGGLLLTPLDEDAASWYLNLDYGFVRLPDSGDLFLAIENILALPAL